MIICFHSILRLQEIFSSEVELWCPKPRLKRGRPASKKAELSEDEDEVPMKKPKVTKKRGRRSKLEAKEDYKCDGCHSTFGSRRQLKDHRVAIQ